MKNKHAAAVLAASLSLAVCEFARAQAAPGEAVTIPGTTFATWSVGEVSGHYGRPAGTTGKVPAVLILHGSNGVDGRGAFHAKGLQEAGIATLEITMFSQGHRPRDVGASMPHAAAALKWLAERPDIQGGALGVMGFSRGGVMTLLMASELVQQQLGQGVPKPVAFAPLYPVCGNTARLLSNSANFFFGAGERMGAAPMLIHVGTRDDYETIERPCDALVATWPAAARERTTVRNLEGATHSFDSPHSRQFFDAGANGGRGGTVRVIASSRDATEAREAIVRFFVANLKQ